MKNIQSFLVNRTGRLLPLMAVFTVPCQGKEAIGECISQIYTISLTLVGLVAFIEIIWGGFLLLTAAGNTSKTGEAMDKIKNAILGIVLLFSSYLILNTINPDLVNFHFNLNVKDKLAKEDLANPNQFTQIENFDVNPKFATFNKDTPLKFTMKVFGTSVAINQLCSSGDIKLRRDIFLKKPANTGTDSTAGINLNKYFADFPLGKGVFGDGKSLDISPIEQVGIKQILGTEPAITFHPSTSPFVELYATFSCGNRELNRSAPVKVYMVW